VFISSSAGKISQVNNLLCQFSTLDLFMVNKLFNSFCCSYYGCELWDLQSATIDDFCVAWRTALRRIWRLPRNSHSRLVPLIADCLPLYDCLCRRTVKFVASCFTSDSPLVRTVAHYGVLTARTSSVIGRNVHFCAQRYGVNCETLVIASDSCEPIRSICLFTFVTGRLGLCQLCFGIDICTRQCSYVERFFTR
jgi:hypothetical protein